MNSHVIRFHCPRCEARIKGPIQLMGTRRDCPGCGYSILVPREKLVDAGPVMVLVESEEGCKLEMASSPVRRQLVS
jgi:DNA-directed RNA polymerase subunit RPC12/RpoP